MAPHVQIQRKEGEFWIPLTGGEPVKVTAGEKMELRGLCCLRKRTLKKVSGQSVMTAGQGRKKYISKYKADIYKGQIEEIESQRDLRKPEVLFYWVDQGTGKVKYVTRADGKEISAEASFEIRKPKYQVTVKLQRKQKSKNQKEGFRLIGMNAGEQAPTALPVQMTFGCSIKGFNLRQRIWIREKSVEQNSGYK